MNQDGEHLRLLSIFHYVCAGVAALCGSFPIIHFLVGLMILMSPRMDAGGQSPPKFVGVLFMAAGAFLIGIGWTFAALLAFAGRCLSLGKNYTFCLVMAGVACLFMPFGTILGIFTILVLIRPSVKPLFMPSPAAALSP